MISGVPGIFQFKEWGGGAKNVPKSEFDMRYLILGPVR